MKTSSILLSFMLLMPTEINANTRLDVTKAFDEMKSLVGIWKKEGGV